MNRNSLSRNAAAVAAMALALATGACKGEKAPENQAAAGTELLPRSVDDDMPAYDTVRSQAELENPEAAAALQASNRPPVPTTSAASTEAASEAPETEATPSPSPTPSASPAIN